MVSLLPKARLLGLCLPLVCMACGEPAPSPSHPSIDFSEELPLPMGARAFSLERENQGPYLERTVERFHAIPSLQGVKSVLWSASGGKLETQGLQATWTLPRAGTASLTLTSETQAGQQLTETFQFRVSAEASSLADGVLANVPLAPVAVDGSNDTTGQTCDLAFDPSGTGHLIYLNETHASIWYATWNGTTWTRQMVDGLGFNTGGIVYAPMALAVDATGTPHIVYTMDTYGGNSTGVWYATLSGNTWIRERVDTPSLRRNSSSNRIAIALDPSNGNRPTIVYTWYGNVTNVGNVRRPVIAYRTGPDAWTSSAVSFPLSQTYYDQELRGEILFDSAGTLYLPIASNAFATWKAGGTVAASEFPTFYYDYNQVSLARTPAGRTLLRSGRSLVDIMSGGTNPLLAYSVSYIEQATHGYGVGDLIVVGGKPQVLQFHGNSLELASPNADNYWVYTDVGTATINQHISLAQRPTTGTAHYCFQSGSKVMFQ